MKNPPLLMTSAGRQKLLATYRDNLLNNILPFWFPRSIDTEHGGFLHCFDCDGSLLDSDKSVWIQGRTSWMLLTLFNTVEKRPEWLAWARSGIEFLNHHCFDTDGRMFFHVTRDGRPIRKRRYAYSESFAAIANAAYARAASDGAAAAHAQALFDLFVDWNFTSGKMTPKFTGQRSLIGLAPRIITIATAQELRANLGANATLNHWIDRCIEEIERLFLKSDIRCVMECVGPNGEIADHFDGRTLNPGHAIEGAWFIMHEGQYRSDQRLIKLGCQMLDWMWERGWDTEFGGIFYFRDVFDKPVQEYWHDMKFWWPHNEAIIGTLLAHHLTADVKYARWHQLVHDWSFKRFADPQHGEWYGYLHRDGRVSVPLKGNLWKGFFHHPRMLWYCWQKLLESEAEILCACQNSPIA